MWQDYVVSCIIWMFVICTIPMVKQVFKQQMVITPITTIPTSIGNYGLVFVWLSFQEPLWISVFSSLSIGTLWLLIAIGSYHNKKKKGRCDYEKENKM